MISLTVSLVMPYDTKKLYDTKNGRSYTPFMTRNFGFSVLWTSRRSSTSISRSLLEQPRDWIIIINWLGRSGLAASAGEEKRREERQVERSFAQKGGTQTKRNVPFVRSSGRPSNSCWELGMVNKSSWWEQDHTKLAYSMFPLHIQRSVSRHGKERWTKRRAS